MSKFTVEIQFSDAMMARAAQADMDVQSYLEHQIEKALRTFKVGEFAESMIETVSVDYVDGALS